MRARRVLTGALLLAPAGLFLLAAYAVPLARILLMSVGPSPFTGEHLARFFREPVYLEVMRTTFTMSLLVTVLAAVLGYPAAYLIATAGPRARAWLLVAVMLPFTTSMLVRTYAWMALLGRDGVVNQAMIALGFWGSPAKLMHNTTGVLVGMVHLMAPFMILSIYAVMRGIDVQLCRAAETLGARPLVSHLTVYLPLAFPGVIAGSLLVFMLSLGFYVTPALLGSAQEIWIAMLVELHVNQLLDWSFAAAIASVLLVTTLGLYIVYVRLFGDASLGELT
jgi:putative spermidine/putrescine transport system permease protein